MSYSKFEIKSLRATTHDNSYGGYPWKVEVVVNMDAKEWANTKKKGFLGQLYGVDISNAVYAINRNIPALRPSVGDTQRASKGIKTISITYYLNDGEKAKALGLTVHQDKTGRVFGSFNENIDLLKEEEATAEIISFPEGKRLCLFRA